MWSFRHDRDVVPLLNVHVLAALFCHESYEPHCDTFGRLGNVSAAISGDSIPDESAPTMLLVRALSAQHSAISGVLEQLVSKAIEWHVEHHLGHNRHLQYWRATNGLLLGKMPIDSCRVSDFADDILRPGDIGDVGADLWSVVWNIKLLGHFIEDHNASHYFEFISTAPRPKGQSDHHAWVSGVSHASQGMLVPTRPSWVPEFDNGSFVSADGHSPNTTLYTGRWARCLQGWNGSAVTLECHLPGRGCALHVIDHRNLSRSYLEFPCWSLAIAEPPAWFPDVSNENCTEANETVNCSFADGRVCLVTRAGNLVEARCEGGVEGTCEVAIRFDEAKGESWFIKRPQCNVSAESRKRSGWWHPLIRWLPAWLVAWIWG
jgi:hypothetical protein